MALQIKDLEVGKIYITVNRAPGYVFQHDGKSTNTHYFLKNADGSIQGFSKGHLSSVGNPSFSDYEEAPPEYAEWLLACMAAGSQVPKPVKQIPKVIDNYSVF